MRGRTKDLLFLTFLALVFTAGLTFASVELPRLADAYLGKTVASPDVATGLNELSDYKTDLYLDYFHLRLVGYVSLALIIVLIIVGFATEKSGWSAVGALVLFLPVFGHFAATMFFLGGLGFLRLLWLPILDVSFGIFRLGDIINLPYEALAYGWSWTGVNRWVNLSHAITALGLLLFFLGTLTWFYARMQKKGVADFWVYRLSRHPQYLGWIVWSYGMMFLPRSNIKLCYELSNSLPWLLSTMIIIGVAMLEELKMKRALGDSYEPYRQRTPFLFPLPRFISTLFDFPLRLMFKKEYPERKREIVAVLAVYTLFCLALSAFYGGVVPLPERSPEVDGQTVEKLARVLKDADNFGEKRRAAGELEKIGDPAMESLLALLNDDHSQVRAYSASALGGMKSERVVEPLIALLHDSDQYVRRAAAGSLGRTRSQKAIQPLVEALRDRGRGISGAAALALGQTKHPNALKPLIEALSDTSLKANREAATALGDLGSQEAVGPLVQCLEEMPNCPYDIVGTALWKLNSERAIDAWIAGLTKGSWWFARVSCAAEIGKHKLEKGVPPLQEALKDKSKEVRRAAVLALMEFESEKINESFRMALTDEDFEVRMYVEEALRRADARRVK